MGRSRQLYVLHHIRTPWQGIVYGYTYGRSSANGGGGLFISRTLIPRILQQRSIGYQANYSSFANSIPLHHCTSLYHANSSSCSALPDFSRLPAARLPKQKAKSSLVLEITQKQAKEAFDHCLQLLQTSDRQSYQAVLTMPKACRAELLALYAFNAELALTRQRMSRERGSEIVHTYRLQFWRDTLSAIYGKTSAPIPRQPVAIALCSFAPEASLPLLDSLVVARQLSIGDRAFKSVDELENYGVATTGVLIRLQAEALARNSAIEESPEQVEVANKLGCAYGIINLLRSFVPLLSQGIVLLPSDLMTLYGLTPDAVYKRRHVEALARLAKNLVGRALIHLSASRSFAPFVPRALCPAFAPSSSVVDHIIRITNKVEYNIYDTRLQRPQPFFLWTLLLKRLLGRF